MACEMDPGTPGQASPSAHRRTTMGKDCDTAANATLRRDGTADTEIVNNAAYKFVPLDNLPQRRKDLRQVCADMDLKGTILLSPEGINLFVAGTRPQVNYILAELRRDRLLEGLTVKESFNQRQPFNRMLVKVKREIIS